MVGRGQVLHLKVKVLCALSKASPCALAFVAVPAMNPSQRTTNVHRKQDHDRTLTHYHTPTLPTHSHSTATRMRRLLQPRPCAAVARRTASSTSTRPSHHQYHHHQYQQQQQQQEQQQQQRLFSSALSSSHAWLGTNSSSNEDKRSGSLPTLPHALDPSRSASFNNSSSFAAVAAITSHHGRRNALFPSLPGHQLCAFSTIPPSSSSSSPSSTTPPPPPPPPPPDTPAKKPTWKDLFKKYGPVFLIYWNGVWLLGGLSIYGALELGNVDPLPLARAIHLDALIDLNKIDPAHGNVAVAIILNEVAELVRFPFVLATVPKVRKGGREGGRKGGREGYFISVLLLSASFSYNFAPSIPFSTFSSGHRLVGRAQTLLLPPCPSSRRLRSSLLG